MPIKSTTHIADESGVRCSRCNSPIPPNKDEKGRPVPWTDGIYVGVIETKFGGVSSYAVGKHDSNPGCRK